MAANIGFELATQQRDIWTRNSPAAATAVSRRVLDVHGPLDPERLRADLDAAIARHEVLRTTFALPTGRRVPLQVVADTGVVALDVVDVSDLGDDEQEARIARLADAPADFDTAAGPLAAITVVARGGDRHALVLTASAAVLDGRSLELLGEELLGGEVEEEPLQFGDYAAWQAELLEDAEPVAAGDEPVTRLPLAGEPGAGVRTTVPVAAGAASLGDADAWLALWAVLAARLTGREQVTISVADHGRPLDEVVRALGPYARDLPVALAVAPGTTFSALKAAAASARSAAETDRERLGAAPAASLLGFSAADAVQPTAVGERSVTARAGGEAGAPQQVSLALHGDEVVLVCDTEAIDAQEAQRLAARVARLARSAAQAPDADVWTLELLGDDERRWLLEDVAQGPELAVPEVHVHHRFEDHAAATPDAPAVAAAGEELTYAELNRRANRIAHALIAQGVQRGGTVALALDRSADLIAAVLGTLKAGAAYLPLNPDHPQARIAFQLSDAGATVLVADAAHAELAAALPVAALRVDELGADLSEENPPRVSAPEDVVYLIYTSGSTGTPKGVETTHAGLGNYIAAVSDRFGFGAEPLRFGLVTTLSTDLGNTSVFPALATGGCLELVPVDAAMDGAAYAAHVGDRPVDVLKITPSHLGALLASNDPKVLPRRRLVLGGEAAPWALVQRVRELGDVTVSNHYGPTETTVGSLTYDVGERAGAAAVTGSVPVGRPLANTVVYVVDAHDNPVASGAPGELLIGGAGLARGYRNQPEQTAERFVADPVGGSDGRVYRTGDVVRVLGDGSLEFLTRVDGQLKIRGFRVELGEVEAVLTEHASVDRVAVVAQDDARGDARLVAYVVAAGDAPAVEDLRTHARTQLPEYMVPSAIVTLDVLPLMANGKLDRKALPSPESVAASVREHVAPSTETERRLVAIWSDAMSLDDIGVQDDFFELGGHSLLATQVIARIRNEFGVQLPLHSLFTAPRIADLAREVDAAANPAPGADDAELAAMLAELEELSDEDAERLLGAEEHGADAE